MRADCMSRGEGWHAPTCVEVPPEARKGLCSQCLSMTVETQLEIIATVDMIPCERSEFVCSVQHTHLVSLEAAPEQIK
jgi:hypothetical protein